jgi:hypothetical protein
MVRAWLQRDVQRGIFGNRTIPGIKASTLGMGLAPTCMSSAGKELIPSGKHRANHRVGPCSITTCCPGVDKRTCHPALILFTVYWRTHGVTPCLPVAASGQ